MKKNIFVLMSILVALLVSFSTTYFMAPGGNANASWWFVNSNDDNGNGNFDDENGNGNFDDDNGNYNGNHNGNYNGNYNGGGGSNTKVNVKGKIDSKNSGIIVLKVRGVGYETVEVSSKTKYKGTASSYSDLSVGQKIKVKGKLETDGKIKAKVIKTK